MSEKKNSNPDFLSRRYPKLSGSPEVQQAIRRLRSRAGHQEFSTPAAQIQVYLDRFSEIIARQDVVEKAMGVAALKITLSDRYVVRIGDIDSEYWQKKMGLSNSDPRLKERLEKLKDDQQDSLDEWIEYLASDAAEYIPDYLKYWIFAGMLKLERYVKNDSSSAQPGRFPKRPNGRLRSAKLFPELNVRALKFITDSIQAYTNAKKIQFRNDMLESTKAELMELLPTSDFHKLYTWAQEHLPPISPEEMSTTDGEWVAYTNGEEAKMTLALRAKGSGWCIVGENLASYFLVRGDIHIYYTLDRAGMPTIPRVIIVQEGTEVTEVRGIEWEENVDEYIKATSIVSDKLKLISDAQEFVKTDQDAKLITQIDQKTKTGQELTYQELIFLYEIHRPIRYFGYKKDARINEIRNSRSKLLKADAKIALGIEGFPLVDGEIAWGEKELRRSQVEGQSCKAYIGPLFTGIFEEFSHLEHLYTSFPDNKLVSFVLSNKLSSSDTLMDQIQRSNRVISPEAKSIITQTTFVKIEQTVEQAFQGKVKSEDAEQRFLRFKVKDLGFLKTPSTEQLYARVKELGLRVCPTSAGAELLLLDSVLTLGNFIRVGIEPVDIVGVSSILEVEYLNQELRLDIASAKPRSLWYPEEIFVFQLPN